MMSAANKDRSDMEIVSHSSIKQLRLLIENAGLSHAGIVDRKELEALAKRAMESDSEPEAEAADIQELGLEGVGASGQLSQSCRAPTITRRRVSLFKMQKKLASTVGETKAGRTTLLKLIGEQGVELIQGLKSAVTGFESREKAKELKKDTVKWIIKVALLWKRQALTRVNAKVIIEQAQLIAEVFCRALETKPCGSREVAELEKSLGFLRENMERLLQAHAQPKNVAKLSRILGYYGSAGFLGYLMNSPKAEQPCVQIHKNVKALAVSSSDVLDLYDRQKERIRYIDLLLDVSPDDCVFSKYPEVTNAFKEFLNSSQDTKPDALFLINGIRFLATTREFRMVSSKTLLAPRAKTIFTKFLGPAATHPVLDPKGSETADLVNAVRTGLQDTKTSIFNPVVESTRASLAACFEADFQRSYAPYLELRKSLGDEKKLLRERVRTYRVSDMPNSS